MWPWSKKVPISPITEGNLASVLEVMLVKRVEAEANLESAKVEKELRMMRERDELRELRRQRAIVRNKTLPRDAKGKLMKRPVEGQAETCDICNGARVFTDAQLEKHRAHPARVVN